MQILSDEEKRQVYDMEGEEGLENLEKGGNRPASPFGASTLYTFLFPLPSVPHGAHGCAPSPCRHVFRRRRRRASQGP